jgi:hypothetical protein
MGKDIKIYLTTSNGSTVTDEGYRNSRTKKLIRPDDIVSGFEKIVTPPNRGRAIGLFILSCFVYSIAPVTEANFGEGYAYFVAGLLFLMSLFNFFYKEIWIEYTLETTGLQQTLFDTEKQADDFKSAMEEMMRNYQNYNS